MWISKGIALIGITLGSVLVLPADVASAATSTPVADSYVAADKPTSNYGTRSTFKADGSPVVVAYLKFAVSGTPASMALRMTATSSQSTGVSIRKVASSAWGETTLTYQNAPPPGATVASTGRISSGTTYQFDVSGALDSVQGGLLTLAVVTTASTSVSFSSREGSQPPQLLVPIPEPVTEFVVSGSGTSYTAASSGNTYTGSLKSVVENAVADLNATGGGTVRFVAGAFNLGAEYFKLEDVYSIAFVGAGMDQTIIQNDNSSASDTEPFNFSGAFGVTISDLTVVAQGAPRTTSDAIDFDRGNDSVVERVKITASRAKGIIFDGKNAGWTSRNNVIRDCFITNVPGSGIEFLASTENLVENTTVTNTGRHGIQSVKSSTVADQPNKKSSDNIIRNNTVDNAGMDGINVTSSDRNTITGNTVTNSSDDLSSRDGIRITVSDGVTADANTISANTATDNQSPKTQAYGVNVSGSAVTNTVVSGNTLAGNLLGTIRNTGTNTTIS